MADGGRQAGKKIDRWLCIPAISNDLFTNFRPGFFIGKGIENQITRNPDVN